MKIAVASFFMSPSIMGWQLALLERLASDGHSVTIIHGTKDYVPIETQCASSCERVTVRLFKRKFTKLLPRLIEEFYFSVAAAFRAVFLPKQDVFLSLTTPLFGYLIPLTHKLFRNKKAYLVSWNMDCHPELEESLSIIRPGGAAAKAMKAIDRICMRRFSAIIALDHAMAQILRNRYSSFPVKPEIRIIPNWDIDNDDVSEDNGIVDHIWEKFDVSNRLRVVYAGNAGRAHEFDTVLETAGRMKNEDRCLCPHFLFVGHGVARKYLQNAKKDLNLDNVDFFETLPRPELDRCITAADIVLITLKEGMAGLVSPSKLYTALRLGKPVLYIGPNGGNVSEAIDGYSCGISLRNGDINGCISALRKFRDDHDYRTALGNNARRAFLDRYSIDSAYEHFLALFAKLGYNNQVMVKDGNG